MVFIIVTENKLKKAKNMKVIELNGANMKKEVHGAEDPGKL